jgi:2-polyprenyl-6-methoxyphenol hydroxylase-like FAD-dependent oxidoreductase
MASIENVLIVGGGIAGLTLAIGLAQKGVRAELVEINPEWSVLGVGLSLTGPTLRALAQIGLRERCLATGFPFSEIVVCDGESKVVDRMNLPRVNGPAYPAMCAIGRPELHNILIEASKQAGTRVRLGTTVRTLETVGDKVDVEFMDGSRATYDLVVGTDGVHSKVRRLLFPDAPQPWFTLQACWRYTLPRWPELEAMHLYYGPRSKAGLNPNSPDEMFLFLVTNIADNRRLPAGRECERLLDELRDFGGAAGELRKYIVDNAKVDYRPMEALLMPPPWHRGRVLIIGDAAHTTTPHLATGAGIAIEDAVVLAEMITLDLPVETLLAKFVERRFERCKLVVETSIQLSRWERFPDTPGADPIGVSRRAFETLAAPM